MSDKVELLPCPFCGNPARLESNRDWHRIVVDHDERCAFLEPESVMVPATDDQLSMAITCWNRRVVPAVPAVANQEPAAWFTDDYATDKSATTYDPAIAELWRAKGWPVSPLYTAPRANQPSPTSATRWPEKGLLRRMRHTGPTCGECAKALDKSE